MSSSGTPDIAKADVKVYNTFDEMDLHEDLLQGVYSYGFERPSEIQKRGIMPIVEGRDLLAQAQSGTGKTGTFTIGALSRVDPTLNAIQVLVIAPTHELAEQHYTAAHKIGSFLGIKCHYAIGGKPIGKDIEAIQKGCQYIIGTPGRIYDLCYRNVLRRDNVRVLIMDEADQMLEDKFQEQIMAILKLGFPEQTRVCLFSATWPPEIVKFTDGLLHDPVRILMPASQVPLEGIKQYFIELEHEDWKFEVLCDIYSQLKVNQAMIFCNKQARVDWLTMKMTDNKLSVDCLHGGMSSEERDKKMAEFRDGSSRILITTDLMARGIDVQQVSVVINFDLPMDKANYIHRIGRAGRYGRKGVTINFVGPNETHQKQEIESYWSTVWVPLPQDLSKVGSL